LESKQELAVGRQHKKNVSAVAFAPDGQTLLSGGLGDEILLWSVPELEVIGRLPGHEVAVGWLTFSPDGGYLGSTGYDQTWKLWSVPDWELVRRFELPANAFPLSFSPDAKVVAVGVDYHVLLYAVDDGKPMEDLPVEAKGVYSVAFSPDGRWLACGSADKKIRVWELA
ncbi:MAG: PD40 domain-containing protein, partial [Anaerolineales bacterium]